MLVAFLPDSDLPHLSPPERDEARRIFAEALQRNGYPGAKVLNACGSAYISGDGKLTPVELPAVTFQPVDPWPEFGTPGELLTLTVATVVLIASLVGWVP